MNTLHEYGVEFLNTKFRLIINTNELGAWDLHPWVRDVSLLLPTKAAMLADKIADLHSYSWIKHRLPMEDQRLTTIEWVEYMSLVPISYIELCEWLRTIHDIDIT